MNHLRLRLLAVAAVLLIAGCGGRPSEPPPLAGAAIGGPFTLVDQDGRARTDRDFAGRWRIMYFGYTFCPDVCPLDLARLAAGWRAFARRDPVRAARVVPIFISVDPARDTPAKVRTFVRAFDPHIIGLTGAPSEIARVAKAFGIAYGTSAGATKGTYLVEHTRVAYLMDPAGKPIALLPQDGRAEAIADELDRWVR